MAKFTVSENEVGQRLDLFLTISSGQFSRSRIRQLLDTAKVKVNAEVEYRPNRKMAAGDEVEIDTEVAAEKKRLPPYKLDLKILYQDDDLILVDKPAGLKVHPTSVDDHESLLNAVYYALDDKLSDYGANLINRIDKDTSGIVAIAISPRGAWFYSRQFAESRVKKEYLAVVEGRWISFHGFTEVRVSGFLKYNSLDEKQMMNKDDGEFSETKFKLLRTSDDKSLAVVLAMPTTGRTHQIRVHLQELGFPIMGDIKYGGLPASRLMLHAYKLTMAKLGGGTLAIASEIPPEFEI